jgi:hypothetical protein
MRLPTAVAGAALILALAGCTGEPSPVVSSGAPSPAASSPAASISPASPRPVSAADFGLPPDASAAAAQAGLPMLGEEHLAVHYHAHLDLVVRGTRMAVPAYIGIDRARNRIAPLHTHTPDGIVHIESATDVPFTLGQLFTAWGHPLSTSAIGAVQVASGEAVRVYRNGELVSGDPAAMVFKSHDEVFVWLGPSSEQPTVPPSYNFPSGL